MADISYHQAVRKEMIRQAARDPKLRDRMMTDDQGRVGILVGSDFTGPTEDSPKGPVYVLDDDKITELGEQHNVPAAVMQFDPEHPVFGALFDGHRLQWIVNNWGTIMQIAKVALQLLLLVAPLL